MQVPGPKFNTPLIHLLILALYISVFCELFVFAYLSYLLHFSFLFFFLPHLSLTFRIGPLRFQVRCLVFSLLCLFCVIVFLCPCCFVDCVIIDLVIMLSSLFCCS